MDSRRDYYEVLGVAKDASQDELKRAYRKLSMQFHPDRQAGKSDEEKKVAEEKFKEVSEAYSVLSDKDKRAQYDQFGFNGPSMGGGGGFSGFDPFEMFKRHFGGSPFGNDDNGGFGPFGFGGMFGGRACAKNAPDVDSPEDGDDLQMQLNLTFKESLFGCAKEVEVTLDKPCPECNGRGVEKGSKPETCKQCNGTGRIVHTERNGFMMSQSISPCPHCHGQGFSSTPCHSCHGSKRVPSKKKFTVKVPCGIATGQRLRVKGHGECGLKGGHDGDIYLVVDVQKSPLFTRDNLDLKVDVPIDATLATLGGNLDVFTPYGKQTIHVKPMTSSKAHVVVPKHGVKLPNGQVGDLVVELSVMPFSNLDDNQKKLLEALRSTLKPNNTYGSEKLDKRVEDYNSST